MWPLKWPPMCLPMDHPDNSPVTAYQIQECTRKDPQLTPAVQFVQQGWPNVCPDPDKLAPFFKKRMELLIYEGCLLWSARVIVPPACWDAVLTELHEGHSSVTWMKELARVYVWSPGITEDIERAIQQCSACQMPQSTVNCAIAPMELAYQAMGTLTPRLRWTCTRKDDTYPHCCSLKMVFALRMPLLLLWLRNWEHYSHNLEFQKQLS